MPPIYLDHNATTPMLPEVADAVREASLRYGANPASQHELGRQARRALESARDRIAAMLGAANGQTHLIFTSGGTESNNLAMTGLSGWHAEGPPPGVANPISSPSTPCADLGVPPRLLISPLEHPSISRTAAHLATQGWQVDALPVDQSGVIGADALPDSLRPETRLVSVMLANNETGALQPVREIAALCRERGVPTHTDATQAVGKIPVNFHELGVDALTFTAHKFHGPVGIGALIVRRGAALASSLHGGFQQAGLRPGTESVALAAGMLAALEAWQREADARLRRLTDLRDQLERSLLAGDRQTVVIAAAAPRLPHTSCIAFTGLDRQALMMAVDLAGVACSTGSACASGSSEPSPALVAMGLPQEQISSALRFSVGATTTAAEVAEGCRRISAVVNRLRRE